MVTLKLENHSNEYELQNIVNLFVPYLDNHSEYKIISSLNKNICSGKILKDGEIISQFDKKVQSKDLAIKDLEYIIRRNLKNTVYSVLAQATGKSMPWGILTGIRPTKIAHKYMKEGYSSSFIDKLLLEEYCISREKANLMLEIARKEANILSKNKPNEWNLYIGIPFCPTRCLYCSFTSYSLEQRNKSVDAYLDALIQEIRYVSTKARNKPIRSLYIGGGTPTSLTETQLERLLYIINECFDIGNIKEYTVEAGRPDTINAIKLKLLKQYGVQRISINPQTMNQNTLEIIGRRHSVQDIIDVFHMARTEGHNNINMDLILGLPEETCKDVAYTMEQIDKLKPDSITVHTMAIKRASRLKMEQGNYRLVTSDDIEKMIQLTAEGAKSMGMEPYYMYRQKNMLGNFENVGYASIGKECVYNVEIMAEQESIIAMGAGAITKLVYNDGERIERIPNVKSLDDYMNRIGEMIGRKKQVLG